MNAEQRYNRKNPTVAFRIPAKIKKALSDYVDRIKKVDSTYSVNKLLAEIVRKWYNLKS